MSNELTLYHIGFSRSTTALWMLEEIGQPYKVHPIAREREDRDPSYLKINPMNKVPALKHGDRILTEAAAICLYLAEQFPEADLNVDASDLNRHEYLKWAFFGPSCLEPAVLDRMFDRKEVPVGSSGWGDFDSMIELISTTLRDRKYFLGDRFTAVDVIMGSQLGWGTMIEKIPETPEIKNYLASVDARPARQKVFEMEEAQNWRV